jgi:hypothetical protein
VTLAATPWEVRLFLRAATVAVAALVVAWLVTAATDEGGLSFAERAGRALPLTPGCAAVGTWAALAPALLRGEVGALEGLGQSPARSALCAVLGGAAVGLAAALAIAFLHAIDIRGFYPMATRAGAWVWENGSFVDSARGVRVGADGAPQLEAPVPAAVLAAIPHRGRIAAALATAAAAFSLPALLATAMLARLRPGWRRAVLDAALAFAAIAASLVLFQAAAARRSPALLAALPPALLLVHAARRYGASR